MTRQRVLILNRWADDFARYERYIDHRHHAVAYITNPIGEPWIAAEQAEGVRTVDSLSFENVKRAAQSLIEAYGPYNRLFAPSEYDLDVAARLREDFAIDGPKPADNARVRDKTEMKCLVGAAGLRIPRFVVPTSMAAAAAFVRATSGPVVMKPKSGAASAGVSVIRSEADLKEPPGGAWTDYEIEEFIDGVIYHADGIVSDGRIIAFHAGRYVNNCLEWANGMPLGSVAVGDLALLDRMRSFTGAVLAAIDLDNSAFHFEFFLCPARQDLRFGEFVFLEIGARVGGGEILFVWRDVYRYDLMGEWARLVLGQAPRPFEPPERLAGWVEYPEITGQPCRVLERNSMKERLPEIYEELLPCPGGVLDGSDPFGPGRGRFRLQATLEVDLARAVHQVIEDYLLLSEPISRDDKERLSSMLPSEGARCDNRP